MILIALYPPKLNETVSTCSNLSLDHSRTTYIEWYKKTHAYEQLLTYKTLFVAATDSHQHYSQTLVCFHSAAFKLEAALAPATSATACTTRTSLLAR